MSAVLSVRGLKKSFKTGFLKVKKNLVLDGVSFTIEPGTITGFLGRNGAGKTTTIKCVLELIFPDEGEVEFFGKKQQDPTFRSRIGFLPERPYFYEYLTGYEFLKFYGQVSTKLSVTELNKRIDELLEKVELTHARDRYLRNFSKGMLQRIGIAQALVHKPEFIILDEPMSGLDPDGRVKVAQLINEVAQQGTTIFFSSHILHDMEQICNRLVVLNRGRVIYEGAVQALLNQLQKGYRVSFEENGAIKSEAVPDASSLQTRIDQIRRQGLPVIEVRNERPSLEEAFVEISTTDQRGAP